MLSGQKGYDNLEYPSITTEVSRESSQHAAQDEPEATWAKTGSTPAYQEHRTGLHQNRRDED